MQYSTASLSRDTEDFTTFPVFVSKQCEWFKIYNITDEQIKCLIFACELRSVSDKDERTINLSKIENPDITLQRNVSGW